jgi:hypothetical protein
MGLTGFMAKKGLKILSGLAGRNEHNLIHQQYEQLKYLLEKSKYTDFGIRYNFNKILRNKNSQALFEAFSSEVEIYDYLKINTQWWQLSRKGEENICWPGRTSLFATSSGTSDAATKYIPVTNEMINSIRRTALKQLITLAKYDLPSKYFETNVMMLGGCTELIDRGSFYEGDLSGIQAGKLPRWFQGYYKPGKNIATIRDWNDKLNAIAKKAPEWNIGVIMGIPAWNQIMIEKILEYHKLKNIHQIWPNLKIFVHGGVALEPYLAGFEKLLGEELIYMETYLASEGFFAYQDGPNKKTMKLVADNGIYYEFVPFNEENFDENNEIKSKAKVLNISQIKEEEEYALLISSCGGAWRYLIGDVVKFSSLEKAELVITGRTKHFLNICGEHLSVDNMNEAIKQVSEELEITIREFTVFGDVNGNNFGHRWYIGTDNSPSEQVLKEKLDRKLKFLNQDYKIKRAVTLKEMSLEILPADAFYKWMERMGKMGGQNKFPRVLNKKLHQMWTEFAAKAKNNSIINQP